MKRFFSLYTLLAVVWLVILVWQGYEHTRVRDFEKTALLNRARDISNTVGIVLRSQRHPAGLIEQTRLEATLAELIKMEALHSVALLNAMDEVVTSAGAPIETNIIDDAPQSERWSKNTVTFVNLVDLGGERRSDEQEDEPATIVIKFPEPPNNPRDRDMPPSGRQGPPRPPEGSGGGPFGPPGPDIRSATDRIASASIESATPNPMMGENRPNWRDRNRRGDGDGNFRGRREGRFFRPPWMSEEQFQDLLQKQGLHKFVMVLSTNAYRSAIFRDLSIRSAVIIFATLATLGLALAWRSLVRSADLQVRLVRASEMNVHLREMNLAAAGLAHETKNPLNIVRGLAQLIAKQSNLPGEIQNRSQQIMEEVDRVTVQLNEFIEYSKPREPKPIPLDLSAIIHDVQRAIETDLEDNRIELRCMGDELTVFADEPLFRQVLFNLLINSIHAVSPGGKIEIRYGRTNGHAFLEISDNGPGIPEAIVEKIFHPYFTTHEKGTGLGLAVVHQIVRAHGWDIQYRRLSASGACFHIKGLKVAAKG